MSTQVKKNLEKVNLALDKIERQTHRYYEGAGSLPEWLPPHVDRYVFDLLSSNSLVDEISQTTLDRFNQLKVEVQGLLESEDGMAKAISPAIPRESAKAAITVAARPGPSTEAGNHRPHKVANVAAAGGDGQVPKKTPAPKPFAGLRKLKQGGVHPYAQKASPSKPQTAENPVVNAGAQTQALASLALTKAMLPPETARDGPRPQQPEPGKSGPLPSKVARKLPISYTQAVSRPAPPPSPPQQVVPPLPTKTTAKEPPCTHVQEYSCTCALPWSRWGLRYQNDLKALDPSEFIWTNKYSSDRSRQLCFCKDMLSKVGCRKLRKDCPKRHWRPEAYERAWMKKAFLDQVDSSLHWDMHPPDQDGNYSGAPVLMRSGAWCFGRGKFGDSNPGAPEEKVLPARTKQAHYLATRKSGKAPSGRQQATATAAPLPTQQPSKSQGKASKPEEKAPWHFNEFDVGESGDFIHPSA